MNEFNRIVVILICRLFITAAVVVVVLAWTSSTSSIDALQDGVEWLSENNQDTEKWVLTAIAAVLGVLALIVLILQPNRPSDDEVRVSDLQGGDAVLSTAATGERVEQAVMQVANVSDVRASVKSWRGDVLLGMDLQVDSEADLVAVTDEACETAKSVLTDRLHVRLAAPPAVRVKYVWARPRAAQRARVVPRAAAIPDMEAVLTSRGTAESRAGEPPGRPDRPSDDAPSAGAAEDGPPHTTSEKAQADAVRSEAGRTEDGQSKPQSG
jgi:hypothetical protein